MQPPINQLSVENLPSNEPLRPKDTLTPNEPPRPKDTLTPNEPPRPEDTLTPIEPQQPPNPLQVSIEHLRTIDSIIAEIVNHGILICIGLMAGIVSISVYVLSTDSNTLKLTILCFSSFLLSYICAIGVVSTNIMIKSLARQEYIRQWHFHKIKQHDFEIGPSDKDTSWIPKERQETCEIGLNTIGYCLSWITMFKIIYGAFFLLTYVFFIIGMKFLFNPDCTFTIVFNEEITKYLTSGLIFISLLALHIYGTLYIVKKPTSEK